MQNKANQSRKVVSSVLNTGSEMRSFCLKQGRGLQASAAHPRTQTSLDRPSPSPAVFLALHADVRSIRSSSRVLQMKVILLAIR